jgi:hypothetical protein
MIPAYGNRCKTEAGLHAGRTGIGSEGTGVIRKFSGPEYCFHEIPGTDRFLAVLSDVDSGCYYMRS